MTYQDDPNNPNRNSYPMTEETNYTGWIVGGVIALAVILGVFAMTGPTDQTGTAANPPATPTTTGSATPDSLPKSPTMPANPTPTVPPGQSR